MDNLQNYLFLQPVIEARIRQAVPELPHVGSLYSVNQIEQQSAAAPACWVIYAGDESTMDARHKHLITQYWGVILSVAYPEQQSMGELLGNIINALSGWQPADDHGALSGVKPLMRAADKMPVQFAHDWCCFPLLFAATFIWPRRQGWTA